MIDQIPNNFHFEEVSNTNPNALKLDYSLASEDDKSHHFSELLVFDKPLPLDFKSKYQSALKLLHLLSGISYYKAFVPPHIDHPYQLSQSESKFFNTTFRNGLGEFAVKNQLPLSRFEVFRPKTEGISSSLFPKKTVNKPKNSLLLFGGGKDSLVSLEILKKSDRNITLFVLNPKMFFLPLLAQIDLPVISLKRFIDPTLIKLNESDFTFNGHIPITYIILSQAILIALIYDFDEIILSAEASPSFGNMVHEGVEVNHQWDKSLEAEKLLRDYVHENISSQLDIFSIIRPYHEIAVVEKFVRHDKYFPHFASCNRNFHLGLDKNKVLWCGECPKCCFIWALLSAFLKTDTLKAIFGKNLYADESLWPTFLDLLGQGEVKPWECVGTPDEMLVAMYMAQKSRQWDDDIIMKNFINSTSLENSRLQQKIQSVFAIGKDHFIPQDLQKYL